MKQRSKMEIALELAEWKAWDSLQRYKFLMFGYHAAQWVIINRLGGFKRKNPFKKLVTLAKARMQELYL